MDDLGPSGRGLAGARTSRRRATASGPGSRGGGRRGCHGTAGRGPAEAAASPRTSARVPPAVDAAARRGEPDGQARGRAADRVVDGLRPARAATTCRPRAWDGTARRSRRPASRRGSRAGRHRRSRRCAERRVGGHGPDCGGKSVSPPPPVFDAVAITRSGPPWRQLARTRPAAWELAEVVVVEGLAGSRGGPPGGGTALHEWQPTGRPLTRRVVLAGWRPAVRGAEARRHQRLAAGSRPGRGAEAPRLHRHGLSGRGSGTGRSSASCSTASRG